MLEIIVERLKGRDIKDACLAHGPFPCHQLVNGPEKGGKGFPASRRCSDENVFTPCDQGPDPLLKIDGFAYAFKEPSGHPGMEMFQD